MHNIPTSSHFCNLSRYWVVKHSLCSNAGYCCIVTFLNRHLYLIATANLIQASTHTRLCTHSGQGGERLCVLLAQRKMESRSPTCWTRQRCSEQRAAGSLMSRQQVVHSAEESVFNLVPGRQLARYVRHESNSLTSPPTYFLLYQLWTSQTTPTNLSPDQLLIYPPN